MSFWRLGNNVLVTHYDWTQIRASLKWYHHKYANQKRETEKKPILETIVEDSTGDVTPVFEDADSMVNSASTSEILIEFLGDVENMVIEYFRPLNTYADIGSGYNLLALISFLLCST